MFKKDYWYAAIIGLITAFFVSIILINTDTNLSYRGYQISIWSLFIIFPLSEFIAYVIASKLFSHIIALKQLGRFGIVGLMNFSVDTGIAVSLRVWTGVDVQSLRILYVFAASGVVAIINSYYWQRAWTFAEKDPPSRAEFLRFVAITIGGIFVNSLMAFLVIKMLTPFEIGFLTDDRLVVVSKASAISVSLFWNFLGYKFFVFK